MYLVGCVKIVRFVMTAMRINEFTHKACKPITYEIDERGCWICTSHAVTCAERQRVMRRGVRQILARYIYELMAGEIPKGMYVLHSCDSPLCINPEHLWLGTLADNNKDRDVKGRQYSKLSGDDVEEMRRRYENQEATQLELARDYNVSTSTVCMAVGGKTWKHIGGLS